MDDTSVQDRRQWGGFTVLRTYPGVKLKELIVDPGKSLSLQRHHKRSELWFIARGNGAMDYFDEDQGLCTRRLSAHDGLIIPKTVWHRLRNDTAEPLFVIEVQWGDACVEEDIERIAP